MEFEVGKLIESIGISVSKAQQGLEHHALQRFFCYFGTASEREAAPGTECGQAAIRDILQKERETAAMEPEVARILMPCDEDLDRKKVVEVPLVALTDHRQVQLDKVTVKVKTKFVTDNTGGVRVDIGAPIAKGTDFSEEPEGDGAGCGVIEMVFQTAGMPEGEARIVQNIERVM